MDGVETSSMETKATETVQGTAAASEAENATPEKVSTLQKFIEGLFSGKKEEEEREPEGVERQKKEEAKGNAAGLTQADLNAAIEAAKQKWNAEKTEQERISKLPPEEKEKEEQKSKEKEVEELKSQLQQRDLKESAVSDLNQSGFSVKLADILDYSSKEKMEASLENVKQVIKESLEVAITGRLKGKTPAGLGGAAHTENSMKDQIAKNIRGGF